MTQRDERYSQNKAEYFTLDFDNVTEAGLKKLIASFKKAGQNVAEVEATNRVITKDRLATKKALLRFEGGQAVTITLGDHGDVIETKLNATIIPVQALKTTDAYAKEVAAKVVAGQARWENSLARKAVKKVTPDESKKKPAGRTLQARIIEAKAANAGVRTNVATIEARIAELQTAKATSTSELESQRNKLDLERATTNQLIQQIEALGGEA
ncbi:hypothetical protein [Aeromonas salmonicida]|uniref:hypothetical protein n=1 Tax=Aeromonas salmonicida TaxID=645 RepID=UPI00232B4215|nr:hypothetical protein [Aeromonas salmonicida]WCH25180.1 hypothetical protein ONZ54_22670 [Aeromonas salmonicida]